MESTKVVSLLDVVRNISKQYLVQLKIPFSKEVTLVAIYHLYIINVPELKSELLFNIIAPSS
jgi:hypothetical protein